MAQRAWSFKSVDQDDLRYYGNTGYNDDSTKHYRFDNFVGNHKQVKAGDIAIITDRDSVLGISIIDSLPSGPYIKHRNKCPEPGCTPEKITHRKTKTPEWRCSNGHEFSNPLVENTPAIEFIAHYQTKYIELYGISMDILKANTLRFNIQSSIQEINIDWAKNLFSNHHHELLSNEADCELPVLDVQDQRTSVLRQIKKRRGQKQFRDKLTLKQPRCAVTKCLLTDILEAAHIMPYRNDSHNDISNGLLLRSDIHTLFDLNLLAIHPITLAIHLSPELLNSEYTQYHLSKIDVKHKLNPMALNERWEIFEENITLQKK